MKLKRAKKAPTTVVASPGDLSAHDARRSRSLVTPEGVDLHLRLGDAGERAAALLIDLAIIVGVLIAFSLVTLLAFFGAKGKGGDVIATVWMLVFFVLRNLYFVIFELTPGAATPGKRAMGLRVAARNGGRLTADAIFARNAMREIELYLPLSFLIVNNSQVGAWISLAGLLWCGVFLLFPLFNRDRLRVGDLVAGTWVVKAPRRKLVPDLARTSRPSPGRFAFTQAQLDAYGVKELHVLEDVLRRYETKTIALVAARIRLKIGWKVAPEESDGDFLAAYYAALRGRLELRLLLGKRRKDKHDQS
ncbi:RDD family protein [Caulobacter sp. DWR2-3-1b2]|uniref:RDD family protein n=1 Tax=unclassified Caulobacter TaxID=2648921 RepID=UPI003CF18727